MRPFDRPGSQGKVRLSACHLETTVLEKLNEPRTALRFFWIRHGRVGPEPRELRFQGSRKPPHPPRCGETARTRWMTERMPSSREGFEFIVKNAGSKKA